MKPAVTLMALLGFLAIGTAAEAKEGNFTGQISRPLHYRPDGTDFVVTNGPEFFNRPLYGLNSAFRIDAGDRPEFSLYLPGRGGNLRLGLITPRGEKWLSDAKTVVARYRPGSMLYAIRDPWLGAGATLDLTAVPMSDTQGLVLRVALRGAQAPVQLAWAYGGANGDRGARSGDIGTEHVPISQYFQLQPKYCQGNRFSMSGSTFTLHSKPGTILGLMPPGAKLSIADAAKWADLSGLLASAGTSSQQPVVVGQVSLVAGQPVYLALQKLPQAPASAGESAVGPDRSKAAATPTLAPAYQVEDLPTVFAAAERHRKMIASQITVSTPDPFINAAAAALCVAGDAVWDKKQGLYMHGAVAWRVPLLGWRGPYVADDLGWHDRARQYLTYWAKRQNTDPIPVKIPTADPTVNLARDEPALHSNGDMSHSHYDMNLVYTDILMRHLLWTGDLHLARQLWPVLQRDLAWEHRLFRRPFGPQHLPLYEAYCCIWASDDLQYSGGGVTHASAYNYYHYLMAARLARLLHKDSAPYAHEAARIRQAMQQNLWLPYRGWFGEYKDLLGLQRVHPNAGLWTFYTTVDSEVPTPMQAWQMSRFVDTQIPHIPIQGPGVPSGCFTLSTTDWMPYTWSTNNVVMAESAHTALAYWEANRPTTAFHLFKGCLLDSMYMGLCPGNAGAMTEFDAYRRESQTDFADGIGTTSRALVEGLFGIHPDVLAGVLQIHPGFPAGWRYATLHHPDLTFSFRRFGLTDTYTVLPHFPRPMALRLEVAADRDGIAGVTVNGKPAAWHPVSDAVGRPCIQIQSPATSRYAVRIVWKGNAPATVSGPAIAVRGGSFQARFGKARLLAVDDPQHALRAVTRQPSSFQATVVGGMGDRTVFAHLYQGSMTWWQPVLFEIRPAHAIRTEETQDAGHLRFTIQNNTPVAIDREVSIRAGGRVVQEHLQAPAFGPSREITLTANGLLPGANPLVVDLGHGQSVTGAVTNWKIPANGRTVWDCVNLAPVWNDQVTQIFRNRYVAPRSPYCSLAMPTQGIGGWCEPNAHFTVDDSGLRAVAQQHDDRLVLPEGIPFQTPGAADAKNIAFTSQWDNYPRAVTAPLSGKAAHAYLLMAGSTNSMQSRIDNGEVIVTYADGTTQRLALRNPANWWPIDQDYLIDDYQFRRPGPIPPRVDLSTGNVRVLDMADFRGQGGKVPGGAATVLDLPLNRHKALKSLTIRTLSNEVVIGLMAVTLARASAR